MGLLDLPAPILSWTDALLASLLAAPARLALWGGIGAALSMGLYRLLSPQRRLAEIAAEERRVKRAMRDEEIDPDIGFTLARRLLRLALSRLSLTLLPAAAAALPVVSLLAWLETRYTYDMPRAGEAAAVRIEPAIAHGHWIAAENAPPRVEVIDDDGMLLQSMSISVPVMVIRKWLWWNTLVGNPLGYLPRDAAVDRIEIALPRAQYLSIGPELLRGWEPVFMLALIAGSLLLKFLFRIR